MSEEKNFRLALPPLVCRALKPDEWHETYLADIAREHGVRRPTSTDVKWLLYKTNTLTLGQKEAAGDAHLLRMLNSGYPRYGGIHAPMHAAFSRFIPTRYCPYCTVEDRYHRGRWRLKNYLICSRHQCFLKLDPLVLGSLDTQTCKGSRPLSEFGEAELLVGTRSCSSDELRAHQCFWGDLEHRIELLSPNDLQKEEAAELVAWSVLSWSLLDRVTHIHHDRIINKPYKRPLESIVDFFNSSELEVSPSMAGLLKFFGCLKAHQTYAGALRHLRVIQRQETARPSLLSRIDFDSLYEAAVGARPEVCVKPPSYKACYLGKDGLGMSFKKFGQTIGVSDVTVAMWARTGRIQTENRASRSESQVAFVPAPEVEAHLRFRRSLVTIDEFLRSNGLGRRVGAVLYRSGLLRTVSYAHCRYVVRESISSLILRLELQSAPAEHVTSKIRLPLFGQKLGRIAWVASDLIALIEASVAGEVRVFRCLDRPGLSAFDIDYEGLGWLFRRIKHRATRRLRASEAEAIAISSLFDEDADECLLGGRKSALHEDHLPCK